MGTLTKLEQIFDLLLTAHTHLDFCRYILTPV